MSAIGDRAVLVRCGGENGTGVLLDGAHVLTARHVVDTPHPVTVWLNGAWQAVASTSRSKEHDAALLILSEPAVLAPVAVWATVPDGEAGLLTAAPSALADGTVAMLDSFELRVTRRTPTNSDPPRLGLQSAIGPDAHTGWQGASGGPIEVGGRLAGLFTDTLKAARQLPEGLPLALLRHDEVLGPFLRTLPTAARDEGVVQLDATWLRLTDARGRISLVLAQLTEVEPVPELLRRLLSGDDAMAAQVHSAGTLLVTLPAMPLDGAQLHELDQIVASCPFSLVLHLGGRAVAGADLAAWRADDSLVLHRVAASVAPLAVADLDLCWLHQPHGPTVVLAHDALDARIELADLVLRPLVPDPASAPPALLEDPTLTLLALHGAKASADWTSSLAHHVGSTTATITSNTTPANPHSVPNDPDRWRALSGVWWAGSGTVEGSPLTRAAPAAITWRGAVLRSSTPVVAAGQLDLVGAWSASRQLDQSWAEADPYHHEWSRAAWRSLIAATLPSGLDLVDCVDKLAPCGQALSSLLEGPDSVAEATPDHFLPERAKSAVRGLEALAALISTGQATPSVAPERQLRWGDRPLLVWASRLHRRELERALRLLARRPEGRHLVVLGRSEQLVVRAKRLRPAARDDVSQGMPTFGRRRRADQPDLAGHIDLLPLSELYELLEQTDELQESLVKWLDHELGALA